MTVGQTDVLGFRLSPQQRRLLTFEAGSGSYCCQGVVRLPQGSDAAILRAALSAVIERHEVLRTTFQRHAGLSVQVIRTSSSPDWREVDWRELASGDQESSLEELLVQERSRRFDLEHGPLLRLCLARRAPASDLLIVTQSSLCSDVRSLQNLATEWARAHDACRGGGSELGDEILQYTSFCEWQNELSDEPADEEGSQFWRDRNRLARAVRPLPLQAPANDAAPFDPRVVARILWAETADAIRARSEALRAPLGAFLLACWGAFLGRHSGDDEWLVGYSSEGRGHELLDEALGLYATWLPVRVETSEALALDQAVRRAAEEIQNAEHWRPQFVWDDVPRSDHDPGSSPFPPAAFQFVESPFEAGGPGVSFHIERPYACSERYHLKLVCRDEGGRLIVELHYDPALHRERDVELLLTRFQTLLQSAAERPEAALGELQVLSPVERRELLEANRTRRVYPRGGRVHDLFVHQVRVRRESVAMVFEERHFSYGFLHSRARRLAASLTEIGVGPEVSVALCLSRSAEFVIAVLAVLEANGAYVPLDPGQPRERLARMVQPLDVAAILTSTEHADRVPANDLRIINIDDVNIDDVVRPEAAPLGPGFGSAPAEPGAEENLAYVMFTSGSTGRPKGVAIEHRQLVNYIHAVRERLKLGEGLSYALASTVAADLGNTCLFASLASGGCLHVLSDERAFDPAAFGEYFARRPVDCLKIVPSHAAALQTVLSPEQMMPRRRLILGGESCEPQLIERLRSAEPECLIHNHYGPTEATIGALTYHVDRDALDDGATSIPIGRPLANTEVYVLDRHLSLVPTGSPGELHIGGAGLARGYSGQPESTAEKFIPHGFAAVPGDRLYKTGDRCRVLRSGDVEFLGRVDRQIKLRGFRVELGEIEAAAGEHPAVRRAVIAVREDQPGERRIVAYVVLRPEGTGHAAADERGIRNFLRERLPEYMVPANVVVLASLPLTPNGKIDRNALPAPDRGALKRTYVAPRNAEEESLAVIWSQVLGVERVGVYDNFFELGGDSIQSIHVVARARQFDLHVTPAQMFQYPTIAELASVLEKARPVKAEQGPVTGPVPLSPIQRWFFDREIDPPQHWNMSLLFEVRVDLDARRLRAAVRELLARHDALRMRFERSNGGWQQFNASFEAGELDRSLSFVDLGGLPEKARKAALEEACADIQTSIDLARGPLFRVVRFEGLAPFGRLLLAIHHLVVDGVSLRILLEDLFLGVAHESPPPAAPKTTSFKHWSERLARHARSEAMKAELAYWEFVTAAVLPPLPRDYPDGVNSVEGSSAITVSLGVEESGVLLSEAHAAYRTQANDVLLTALVRAFASWTGATALRVELEGHGREDLFEDVDLSRTVGWFTTRFPVNLDLGEIRHPGEALKSIKEQLRSIPGRGIGYGLHRYLTDGETAERLGRAVAEVSFNYFGHLDQAIPPGSPIVPAAESSGPPRSPRGNRKHLIEIVGAVVREQFQFHWTFCRSIHDPKTVEDLAAGFLRELSGLIHHCQSPDAGGYTPSDFPLAKLDRASLDRLTGGDRNVEDIYPLSPLQAGMLFHSVYAPGDVYFERLSGTLEGDFDVLAFRKAWERVVERHGVLRTAVVWNRLDAPLNLVRRRVELPWFQEDWRGFPSAEQSAKWEAFLEADRSRAIDLEEAPLMRVSVVRTADEVWRFAWSHHHLVLDGWSSSRTLREVLLHYQSMAHGREFELDSPRPYRDFVEWLSKQDLAKAKEYWRKVLKGITAPTSFGIERPSASDRAPTLTNRRQQINLSPELTASLEAMARQNHLTLNSVIHGTWAILLSRYSGERDVLFGVTVSGRTATLPGIESMLGVFINSLPARADVPSSAALVPWLQSLQSEQAELRGYEFCPLVSIQGFSDIPRGVPLFESLLVFENYPLDRSVVPPERQRLSLTELRVEESTNYPLTLLVIPGPALTLRALYDGGLLDGAAVGRLLRHAEALLEEIARDANRPVYALSMLTDEERAQLLTEWTATERRFPLQEGVHGLLEVQALTTPDTVALVFGDRHLSYRELNAGSDQLAQRLRSLGAGPEERVGIFLPRSAEMALAVAAVLKTGAAYVPLDPLYPPERLRFMLEDSRAGVLVTTTELERTVPDSGAVALCVDADARAPSRTRGSRGVSAVSADNLAYVIYTSGSTGRPKGVGLSHDALTNLIQWHQEELIPGSRILQFASLSFDASFHELFAAWSTGGTVFMVSEDLRQDVRGLIGFLLENSIEKAILPVVLLQQLAEIVVRERRDLPDLKELITTGEQLQITPGVAELFVRHPGCSLHNHYGPSETHVVTAFTFPCADRWPKQIPIGRPIANTEILVLDPDGSLLPAGVTGELFIGGSGLARGYQHRPSLTAEKFVPHPFAREGGARLYRTGDRARWRPDGELEFLGRRDHQVKVRGFRVELGEIEAVLSDHPAVQQCAVVSRVNRRGEAQLVAYLVAEPGCSIVELKSHLRGKLPEHMVPAAFIALDRLPLTANRKVNREALPAPDGARPEVEGVYVAPRSPVEEELARMWAALLGVERVGVHDGFFELGGHSLLATQLISRVREAFDVELSPRDLFDAPTVAGLARAVEGKSRIVPGPALVPVPRDADLPLSFAQQRLWILDQILPGNTAYIVPAVVRLSGRLNVAALARALNEIARRHEVLRTNFSTRDGLAVQRIRPSLELALPIVDLSGLAPDRREAVVGALANDESDRPFDLERDPLLRATLLRFDDDEHVVLFTMHHVVSDAWSMGLMVREVATLYVAFSRNRPSPLADLKLQYADFAFWQRQWLSGEVLERHLQYWRAQLHRLAPLPLEIDRPRPSIPTFRGAGASFALESDLSMSLRRMCLQEGVTLFMTLLAGFQAALRYCTGADDVAVGTDVANRTRIETEDMMGFFINQLVLRTDLSGDPTFRELLRRVREVTLEAYAHQDLPFEKLVDDLGFERDMSQTPLFQVKLVLQNAPLPPAELPGISVQPISIPSTRTKFDLLLNLWDTEMGLSGAMTYSTDVFDGSTVSGLLAVYHRILEWVVAEPDISLRLLDERLAAAEQSELSAAGRDDLLKVKRVSRSLHADGPH